MSVSSELQGDFLLEFVNKADIRGSPTGAGLDIHLGGLRINCLDPHPHVAVGHAAFQGANRISGVMGNKLGQNHAIPLHNSK